MHLEKKQQNWFVFTLLLGTFTMSISQSALSTAYPTFMKYFNLPASTIAWLTTGFMLIMCVVMPLSPWLLNNIKFKKLYLSLLAIFLIGTIIIIWAPSFPIVMLGRLMEGFSVGVLFPSYQSVILEITPKERRGATMGTVGLVMGSALAVGPIVSGILLQIFNWQSIFAFFLILLTVVLVIATQTMVSPMKLKPSSFDFLSVFLSLGIIGLLYFINELPKQGGHLTLWVILIISLGLLYFFVQRQLHSETPLLHLDVLKVANFDLGVALTAISYMSLITITVIMPLYYQQIIGLSPLWSGLSLVPAAALLSWLNRRSGKMADRVGFKRVMLIGITLFIIGWGLLLVNPFTHNLWIAIIASMIIESGNAFVMMPATTLGANSLPNERIPHGSSIIATFRQIMGSTAVVIATVILGQSNFKGVFLFFLVLELLALYFALQIKDTKSNK
ncbi:MFS transporter [Pediococcus argentinicus]|uniref:MFS family major facilitator transporter, multidrug cation symporter n=1 Tax=Pediococcus argentinicus TaxID=480391 RepID=A0A0R2NA21_9LACO|nr:MFS transporter [Pediococcus argentinicus]KRO22727.1 MFS family major facilitator transporter, multidrug cation symporter [Pediococcus argentinicus]NKZ23000.1 multidrug efflux MFS transporter [Pediococcus argentinicus]GEP20083.1 MFS transporter [Pediococcus argentinicus]